MKFRTALITAGIVLITLLAVYFLFRNTLLQWSFERIQTRAQQNYNLNISTSTLSFSGFDGLHFKDLIMQPNDADTLLRVNELDCNLSLTALLKGQIAFDEIKMNGAECTIYNRADRNNFKFSSQTKKQPTNPAPAGSYLERRDNWKEKFFRAFGTAYHLKDIHLTYSDSTLTENIFIPALEYDLKNISGLLINRQSGDSIFLTGNVLKKNKSYTFSLQHSGKANAYLPFLDRERGLKCRFSSVTSTLNLNDQGNELEIITDSEAKDFRLNHWRIANEDVVFPNARFTGTWKITDESIELDSSSVFTLREVPFKLFASYSTKPKSCLALHVHMPETISDSAFHALPGGMFQTLKGISCTGTLAYDLQFFIDTEHPDSLTFSSSLSKKNFRLNHFGAENYSRINAPFIYDAYDKDRFVRKIVIGPENPMFTPLNKMSSYLPKAVLQSEDPSFMQHRGFLAEAFRESIIKNYKEKRFARGGSTISMQLVKNIFLSRDKTIARKAEEALIVWLIENLGLVSKERMFEIYLNVIEWGPNVYGIGEASRFYFNKKPSELNLQESIFLASLIPAPRYFRYRFDKQGKLKPELDGYFRILTSRMAGKGWLTPSDTIGLLPEVILNGPALRLILPADSSIGIEEEEDF